MAASALHYFLKSMSRAELEAIIRDCADHGTLSFQTNVPWSDKPTTIFVHDLKTALHTPPQSKPMAQDDNDLERLIKVLKMTTSDNDNQALVAIRTANKQLDRMKTDWDAILRGKVKIIADPFASVPRASPAFATPRRAPPPPTAPPPHPQPQWTPPPPPQPRPQPAKPTLPQGYIPNSFDGTCIKCKGNVIAGKGMRLKAGGPVEHLAGECLPAGAKQFTTPGRTNRHPAACVKCGGHVPIGQGLLNKVRNRWEVTHIICPTSPKSATINDIL